MGVFGWLFSTLWEIVLDLTVFVLVDALAKSPLRKANSDSEKQRIWFLESVVLILLCLAISWLHHGAYFLLLLTTLTFMYTQMQTNTVNFQDALTSVRAHWDNYIQHEDNMKQIQRQQRQQQQLQQQALGMAGLPPANLQSLSQPAPQQQPSYQFPFMNKQGSLRYPPNATVVPGQDRPTYSMSPSSASYRDAVQQSRAVYNNASPMADQNWSNVNKTRTPEPYQYMQTGRSQYEAGSNVGRSQHDSGVSSLQGDDMCERKPILPPADLERRPLRPDSGKQLLPRPLPSTSPSITSRFMEVLGLGPSLPKPVGLINNNQNMCFINCVAQCLARGPHLAQCLTADAAKELQCSVAESELLSSLSELLDLLSVDPQFSDRKTFEASRFRKAASELNAELVKPPSQPQVQQDVAELLMWLLAAAHSILNKSRQALRADPPSCDARFTSPRLARLRMIYGDLNAPRIKDLKDQCRREIAVANGLENESYAEPIQRLSDLEWLTHKQANDTVIDGLFTGQMVEAYHSLGAGHISVALQAFSVLPVPLAAPRPDSSLVLLEDCFTTFCHIETLSPPGEGGSPLVTLSTLRERRPCHASMTPVSHRSVRQLQQDPALPTHLPSPIHGGAQQTPLPSHSPTPGEGTMSDSGFRTSTPISRPLPPSLPPPPGGLQRRCLLRQLPECLIIQLMRFQYDSSTGKSLKLRTPVSVRLKGLDLREVVYDTVAQRGDLTAGGGSHVYDLYGMCLHLGSDIASGHYVSLVQQGGKWWRANDAHVEEVNMEFTLASQECRQNAYMLFYKKVHSGHG